MEYIVAKEQVILSIGGPGNMTAKGLALLSAGQQL
jgi:hypothetical protein